MRRLLGSVAIAMMLAVFSGASIVAAQEATPEATPASILATAGLPELRISVSETGYEGVPDQVAAGRYLVTVSAAEDMEFGGGLAFIQPPEGMSADEFLAAMAGPPDETGVGAAAATPIEGLVASPAAEDGAGGPPDLLFQARYAGGAYAEPGSSSQVVLDLGPGEWIAAEDSPEPTVEPVTFEVTGEMPADLPEPESSATIIMAEYIIEVSEGQLVTGPQVVRIDNIGAQPHYIGWFQGPDGMTLEQIEVVFEEETAAEMSGTPVAYSDLNPEEDLMPVTFTATQSTGTSIWIEVNVEAGTHGLICFFPDISDGIPHAYHGMYNVIEIPE